uniref:Disease resistance N-terminal domain-containing protein n=1 Tax=Opuntia streptacantha TaxID=393608 RepID=A0A7C8ZZH4_OPUST
MEAAGLAFSVAQTLLAALSYPPLQQMFTMWGYQSELENLERTVSTVSAVLLDAQSVDEEKLSNYERNLIEKLKDAVYDADDLLDEFATLAKRQHQLCMEGNEKSLTKV